MCVLMIASGTAKVALSSPILDTKAIRISSVPWLELTGVVMLSVKPEGSASIIFATADVGTEAVKEGNTLKNKNTKVHQWISVFIKLKTFYYVLLPLVYVGIFIVNQSSFESIESAKDIYFTIVFIFTSLFFFTLSIYLLIKPKLFVKLINYKAPTENKEGLTMDNIILTVSTNALYKDPELNLERLAKQINIKKSELTLIIQNSSYENFRDFLNTIRLENMVNHISKKDYEIKSITGLAKEYGFKSESTFYRIFKKQFNQTPQNYFSSSFL